MKYYLSPILANSLKIQASQSYFPAPCHLLLLYPCIIYGCFAESIYYSLNYNPFKQGWRFLLGQLPLSSAVCIYDMIMTDLICHSWHNLCHHLLSDKLCENATDEKKKKKSILYTWVEQSICSGVKDCGRNREEETTPL